MHIGQVLGQLPGNGKRAAEVAAAEGFSHAFGLHAARLDGGQDDLKRLD
jgi:hypothetical protein